jgi:Cof subfamily protein (haloacid dehalogenase superfamily)
MDEQPRAGPHPQTRLVAIDVDGTLLTSSHRVTDRTRASVEGVRARGIEVVLASSRGVAALASVLRDLAPTAPIAFIASLGAVEGTWSSGRGFQIGGRAPMDLAAARATVALAHAAGFAVNWYCGDEWYASRLDETVEAEARIVGCRPELLDLQWAPPPDKLLIISPTTDSAALDALGEELPAGLGRHISRPAYLEITKGGVDKAIALRSLCLRRRIPPADVAVIGDGPNDLGMFAFAGSSIAPANATPEVLAAATYITRGNDEAGVAAALDRLP